MKYTNQELVGENRRKRKSLAADTLVDTRVSALGKVFRQPILIWYKH
ncbi:MAG: hypothetical protein ACR2MG_12830 [Pyrinomonadaceae bacterium]